MSELAKIAAGVVAGLICSPLIAAAILVAVDAWLERDERRWPRPPSEPWRR